MTNYITLQEFYELSAFPAEMETDVDPETITFAIVSATARVNSYLSARYTLPLVTVGGDIKQATADIAGYWVVSQEGYENLGSDEEFRRRFEDAIEWLKDVAKGLVTPDVTATSPSSAGSLMRWSSKEPRGW